MREIRAEGAKYDELLKYVFIFFPPPLIVLMTESSSSICLCTFRRHHSDSKQDGVSLAEKTNRVCSVCKKTP